MNAIDIRNANWSEMVARLDSNRRDVYHAWCAHGPGSTREVSAAAGMDILSFRPRTTELYQAGLVMLVKEDGGQGIYRVRGAAEWEALVRRPARRQCEPAATTHMNEQTPNKVAYFTAARVPQPDGSVLIRPGAARVMDEISVSEFARLKGMAKRTALRLCEEGKIKWRRLTPRGKSKFLIPASELQKFQDLQ